MDVPRPTDDEGDVEMVWETDWDHPSLAPMDPHDRLALSRGPDWDAPIPMRQRAVRRPASEGEVRRMQFETARRVIFGTQNVHGYSAVTGEPMPGKEPREAWTTAGFVRPSEISYRVPFKLGDVTLMITQGLNKVPPEDPSERRDNPTARSIQVVWMEMPSPIIGMTLSRRPEIITSKSDLGVDGILINYQWVCIGYLRSDDFIPVMPNFASLLYVETRIGAPPGDRRWGHAPQADFVLIGPSTIENGQLMGHRIRQYAPLTWVHSDLSDPKSRGHNEFRYAVSLVWKQLVPSPIPDAPPGVVISPIVRFDERTPVPYGTHGLYKVVGVSQFEAAIHYEPALPISEAHSVFRTVIPEEFLAQLGPAAADTVFFSRNFSSEQGDQEPATGKCAWKYGDVAAVIYAQSYLLYVLSGPDRRRYEGPREGMAARFIPDAKETLEPPPCFRINRAEYLDNVLQVELLGPDHVPFVSAGTSLRFFTPSLALRAARVLQTSHAWLANDVFQRYPDGSAVFARLVGRHGGHRLFRDLAAMQIPLDRFEEYEFMGAQVEAKVLAVFLHSLVLFI